MPIIFHKEEIEIELPSPDILRLWLNTIAKNNQREIKEMTYIFCSDDYLLEINRSYLNHDYYTDIITFPYVQGREIQSDIFISIDRVKDNATEYGVDFEKELLRVIAHGLLHMIGYGDKSEEDQAQMTEMENQSLLLWNELS